MHRIRRFPPLAALLFAATFLTLMPVAVQAADNAAFVRAIKQDNAPAMQRLLEQGASPNTLDDHGNTGLYVALQDGSLEVADVLLRAPGLSVDLPNAAGETALMMAVLKGHGAQAHDLLEHGAEVNRSGWTPLHYAATGGDADLVSVLLARGADLNAPSPNGTTPLMMAARYGSEAAVELLLEAGADVGLRNQKHLNALDFAEGGERPDAVRLIRTAMQAQGVAADSGW